MTTPTPEPTTAQVLEAVRITQAFYARDTTEGRPYSTLADDLQREVGRLERDVERENAAREKDDTLAKIMRVYLDEKGVGPAAGALIREYLHADGWVHRDDLNVGWSLDSAVDRAEYIGDPLANYRSVADPKRTEKLAQVDAEAMASVSTDTTTTWSLLRMPTKGNFVAGPLRHIVGMWADELNASLAIDGFAVRVTVEELDQ